MNGPGIETLYDLIWELRDEYPGFEFTVVRCHGGPRLQARRTAGTSGLYLIITGDVAELRRELDAATPARARM